MVPSSMGAQAGIIGQLVIESKSQTGKVALAFLFLSGPRRFRVFDLPFAC